MEDAKYLSKLIPQNIKKIGVFVNESIDKIKEIQINLNLDLIQLHGNEDQKFIDSLNLSVIKALRIQSKEDLLKLNHFLPKAFLLDTFQPGLFGGTGATFNWEILNNLITEIPIILSGGLNSNNIEDAQKVKNISGWDINSGVENCPGEKDDEKLNSLFSKINLNKVKNIFDEL